MMARDFSMSSGVTGAPSVDFAVSTTEQTALDVQALVDLLVGRVNSTTDTTMSRVVMR